MIPFEAETRKATKQRAKTLEQTVAFHFRQHYRLAPTDERYLRMTELEMVEEMRAVAIYMRRQRGEPELIEYDSDETEEDLLNELDALDDADGLLDDDTTTAHLATVEDILRELDTLEQEEVSDAR